MKTQYVFVSHKRGGAHLRLRSAYLLSGSVMLLVYPHYDLVFTSRWRIKPNKKKDPPATSMGKKKLWTLGRNSTNRSNHFWSIVDFISHYRHGYSGAVDLLADTAYIRLWGVTSVLYSPIASHNQSLLACVASCCTQQIYRLHLASTEVIKAGRRKETNFLTKETLVVQFLPYMDIYRYPIR